MDFEDDNIRYFIFFVGLAGNEGSYCNDNYLRLIIFCKVVTETVDSAGEVRGNLSG